MFYAPRGCEVLPRGGSDTKVGRWGGSTSNKMSNTTAPGSNNTPPSTGRTRGRGGVVRRTRRTAAAPYVPPREALPLSNVEDAQNFPSTGKNGPRLQEFIFTIHGDLEYLKECWAWFQHDHGNPTWFIVGKEICPKTNRKHLQGAMVLGKRMAFTSVKKWFPFRGAHIIPMRGTPADSQKYCRKQDPDAMEFGACPEPKKKSLEEGILSIQAGNSMRQLATASYSGAHAIVVHGRGLRTLQALLTPPRDVDRPPRIYWFYGSTGTGKTRSAHELGLAYGPGAIHTCPDPDLKWFDGYENQPIGLFDDFRGDGVSFGFLLRVTDRFPIDVPIKGGFVPYNPAVIIFTAPSTPRDMFYQHKREDIGQLERRITGVFDFDDAASRAAWEIEKPEALASLPTPAAASIPDRDGGRDLPRPTGGPGYSERWFTDETAHHVDVALDATTISFTSGEDSDSEVSIETFMRRTGGGLLGLDFAS